MERDSSGGQQGYPRIADIGRTAMILPTERKRLADALLALTENMHAAIGESRWEDLVAMEEERERLVVAVFGDSGPDSSDDGEWLAVIRRVQSLNDALVNTAIGQRDRLAHELISFRSARKAESIYAQAMGSGNS